VRIEATLQVHPAAVRSDLSALQQAAKLPLTSGNYPTGLIRAVAHRHHVGGIGWVGDLVSDMIAVCQGPVEHPFGDVDLASNQPLDRVEAVGCNGGVQSHEPVAMRRIELPAQPQQGKTVVQEQTVAHLLFSRRVEAAGGEIEDAQYRLGTPIGHFVQDRTVAAQHIPGLEQKEVRVKLDLAVGISGREADVGDDRVGRVVRVDCEVDLADQSLVWPGQTERLAVDHIRAGLNLDPHHFRIGG